VRIHFKLEYLVTLLACHENLAAFILAHHQHARAAEWGDTHPNLEKQATREILGGRQVRECGILSHVLDRHAPCAAAAALICTRGTAAFGEGVERTSVLDTRFPLRPIPACQAVLSFWLVAALRGPRRAASTGY
jgi:hypothetical protein